MRLFVSTLICKLFRPWRVRERWENNVRLHPARERDAIRRGVGATCCHWWVEQRREVRAVPDILIWKLDQSVAK